MCTLTNSRDVEKARVSGAQRVEVHLNISIKELDELLRLMRKHERREEEREVK